MVTPLCETCNLPMEFIGEYHIACMNEDCANYGTVFEYGGEDYPVQLTDSRQMNFQWDHSDSHENVLEHSQE